MFAKLDAFRKRVGEKAFSDAFNGGQYSRQDGIFYGGMRPQWSNSAFRAAVETHLERARKVCYMDLHTGIGPWCEHIYLCFHSEGSAARERARSWWGERAVNLQGVTHKQLATYTAPSSTRAEMLRRRKSAPSWSISVPAAAPRKQRQHGDRCMRFEGPAIGAGGQGGASTRRPLPEGSEWRKAVLEQSRDFIARGVAGISSS